MGGCGGGSEIDRCTTTNALSAERQVHKLKRQPYGERNCQGISSTSTACGQLRNARVQDVSPAVHNLRKHMCFEGCCLVTHSLNIYRFSKLLDNYIGMAPATTHLSSTLPYVRV